MVHPTVAAGVAMLAWLVVRNWSLIARVLLAVALLLLAWEPASGGAWWGILLTAMAAGVAVSVVWDDVRGRRPTPRSTTDGSMPSPSPSPPPAVAALPVPGIRHGRVLPAGVVTELERAEWFGDLLDVNIAGYEEARRSGDLRAQAAFVGEIEELATEMRTMLRVVLGERRRVAK